MYSNSLSSSRFSFRAVIYLTLFGLVWYGNPVRAQQTQRSRQVLEKEKKQNLEKMSQIRTILKQTASEKQAGLGQLKALNQQIQIQSKQIGLLK